MKKNIFILFLSLLAFTAQAQDVYNSSGRSVAKRPAKKTGFDRDKLVVGGDFRFTLGQQISLGVAPMIGYQIVDHFFAGIKIGYSFDRIKADYNSLPASATTNVLKYNSFTGGIWARYLLWESVYIHTEFEYNSYQDYFVESTGIVRKSIQAPSVLVGIGFRQPISDRVSFNTTILYDVLKDPYSYYYYHIGGGFDFRLGILVGF